MPGYARSANPQATGLADEFVYGKQLPGETLTMPSADIFTKAVKDKAGTFSLHLPYDYHYQSFPRLLLS